MLVIVVLLLAVVIVLVVVLLLVVVIVLVVVVVVVVVAGYIQVTAASQLCRSALSYVSGLNSSRTHTERERGRLRVSPALAAYCGDTATAMPATSWCACCAEERGGANGVRLPRV